MLIMFTKMEPMAKSNLPKYTLLLCVVLVFTLFSVKETASEATGTKIKTDLLFLHRKVYLERKKTGFKISGNMPEGGSYGNHETPEEWELRRVPAGPDPLHHNARDPTKPRTP